MLCGACEFHGIFYAVRGTCSKPAGKAVRQRYSAMQRIYWRPWWEGLKDAERKPPHVAVESGQFGMVLSQETQQIGRNIRKRKQGEQSNIYTGK